MAIRLRISIFNGNGDAHRFRSLTTTVRECDVARMGGDEFVILLPETGDRTSIESVCARILAVLAEAMLFNGCVLRAGGSIGIAVFPYHGRTWQAVYKSADLALYEAKRCGRANWRWYVAEEAGKGVRPQQ